MNEDKKKKVCCTNMSEDDPIIEKFLKEYLSESDDKGCVQKNDDLVVNFEVTYADGDSESYTCNNESEVFGDRKDDKENEESEEPKGTINSYYTEKANYFDIGNDMGKWVNCVDEWCECSTKRREKEKQEVCKEDEKVKPEVCIPAECDGKITVYSILSLAESTTLKGVTVNLYKINGIKPELVDSQVTDEMGKAVFSGVKEGNYRIIQIIDKRYFEKPTYLTWNEVNICESNQEYVLYVLNSLKNYKKN